MLGVCSNGHLTGMRRCPLCGGDRKRFAPGEGRVEEPRHERRKRIARNQGRDPLGDLRRSTRVSGAGGTIRPNVAMPATMGRGVFA